MQLSLVIILAILMIVMGTLMNPSLISEVDEDYDKNDEFDDKFDEEFNHKKPLPNNLINTHGVIIPQKLLDHYCDRKLKEMNVPKCHTFSTVVITIFLMIILFGIVYIPCKMYFIRRRISPDSSQPAQRLFTISSMLNEQLNASELEPEELNAQESDAQECIFDARETGES